MNYKEIKSLVNKSQLHVEIVLFFHQNPACIDTPRGIATWVRGDLGAVKKVLDEFVAHGILVDHKASSTTGYSYTMNPKIISQVEKVLNENCGD
jgi:hypothetical protein